MANVLLDPNSVLPDLRRRSLLCGYAVLLLCPLARGAGMELRAEYKIKAAYLYKFVDYVTWPGPSLPAGDSPVVLGVAAAPTLLQELGDVVANRQAGGRSVLVRAVSDKAGLEGLHVLFLGRADPDLVMLLLETSRRRAILSVTEVPSAMPEGSVINFVTVEDRVRFDVSTQQAEHAGLRVSAALLRVARTVFRSPA